MHNNMLRKGLIHLALTLAIAGITTGTSFAQTVVRLCADEFVKTMPDGAMVTMWGFATDPDLVDDGCGAAPVLSPGPPIVMGLTDTTLTIELQNSLPAGTGSEIRKVSVVIPALGSPTVDAAAAVPERDLAPPLADRATSLVQSVAIGGDATYVWTGVTPGTYLYHSGTHMTVQMQMGLYGAVILNDVAGEAYSDADCGAFDGTAMDCHAYDHEALLVYSEVDPALHAAVVAGSYGPPSQVPSTTIPSTSSSTVTPTPTRRPSFYRPPAPLGICGYGS